MKDNLVEDNITITGELPEDFNFPEITLHIKNSKNVGWVHFVSKLRDEEEVEKT